MNKKNGIAIFPGICHPLNYIDDWDMPSPYDWQVEVMQNVIKPHSRVAISTCNESGKTSLIVPLLGLSVMSVFPGSIIVSTAGAEEQIKGQLFSYLQAKLRPHIQK